MGLSYVGSSWDFTKPVYGSSDAQYCESSLTMGAEPWASMYDLVVPSSIKLNDKFCWIHVIINPKIKTQQFSIGSYPPKQWPILAVVHNGILTSHTWIHDGSFDQWLWGWISHHWGLTMVVHEFNEFAKTLCLWDSIFLQFLYWLTNSRNQS